MEKIVKLEGLVYEKKYIYYVTPFEDGVYVCKSLRGRRGGNKDELDN